MNSLGLKLECNLLFSLSQISSSRRSCLLPETQVSCASHDTGFVECSAYG